jgi:hypothetical protein
MWSSSQRAWRPQDVVQDGQLSPPPEVKSADEFWNMDRLYGSQWSTPTFITKAEGDAISMPASVSTDADLRADSGGGH